MTLYNACLEVADFVCVSCDGHTALIDFDVWDDHTGRLAQVRVSYRRDQDVLVLESSPSAELSHKVLDSEECLNDVRETLAYQRDLNREKN